MQWDQVFPVNLLACQSNRNGVCQLACDKTVVLGEEEKNKNIVCLFIQNVYIWCLTTVCGFKTDCPRKRGHDPTLYLHANNAMFCFYPDSRSVFRYS